MTTVPAPASEIPGRLSSGLAGRLRDGPLGDGQPGLREQLLRCVFLELHGRADTSMRMNVGCASIPGRPVAGRVTPRGPREPKPPRNVGFPKDRRGPGEPPSAPAAV